MPKIWHFTNLNWPWKLVIIGCILYWLHIERCKWDALTVCSSSDVGDCILIAIRKLEFCRSIGHSSNNRCAFLFCGYQIMNVRRKIQATKLPGVEIQSGPSSVQSVPCFGFVDFKRKFCHVFIRNIQRIRCIIWMFLKLYLLTFVQ